MDNSYFTQVAPYMQQDQGLMPVFQNIAQQQQNQNTALQQQMQNNQMAGQVHGASGGMNPMAMAAMLRNKQGGNSIADRAANYFGTQQSPEMQAEINKLGSSTWNPMSNYYTGANGWGNYGE